MKAKINGFDVEGTPQEILEFQRLQEERNAKSLQEKIQRGTPYVPYAPYQPTDRTPSADWLYRPHITCDGTNSQQRDDIFMVN